MRRLVLLALFTLAACEHQLPLAPHARDAVVASSTGGKIAFTATRDGNAEIYVMNSDGSDVTNLTNNPANDVEPTWSSDGRRIAFVSNRDGPYDVYVMDADGTGITRLTTNAKPLAGTEQPAWCGNRIAFVTNGPTGFPNVYVMSDDGTGATRLVQDNASFMQYPAWSPDCSKIAFTKDPGGMTEIYVVNPDGTELTRLTNNPRRDQAPAWSPDGTRIAFESSRDGPQEDVFEIYVMKADGSDVTRLTFNDSTYASQFQDQAPTWSPDGSQIAFQTNRDSQTYGPAQIYVMNADGSGVTRLTTSGTSDTHPAWSPAAADTTPPPPPPDSASLMINTTTTGDAPDTNGYTVTVAGSDTISQALAENDGITVGLQVGTYAVTLSGVADNCTVTTENPSTVTLAEGTTESVDFTIDCPPAPAGAAPSRRRATKS